MAGLPLGLIGLANQDALHVQSDPERTGSSAGLLRTSSYVGAIAASAAIGPVFPDRADTGGPHGLAVLMLVLAGTLLVLTGADRSLRRLGWIPRAGLASRGLSPGAPAPRP